jgi:LmbE family N-acetylglucosaminyl deacetylase
MNAMTSTMTSLATSNVGRCFEKLPSNPRKNPRTNRLKSGKFAVCFCRDFLHSILHVIFFTQLFSQPPQPRMNTSLQTHTAIKSIAATAITVATIIPLVFFCFFAVLPIAAQPAEVMNAGKLKLSLNKLTTLGSVLYVAAHPDDENTALISYCANGRLLRTAYLSMTRGDGGQNLIGSEQSELMGLIRTQELLAARRIDGGEQMFSRAIDFGYSKTPDETLKIWGRERILADVVWAIRKFRPDVILTRFPKTGEGGHGHHTSSALLAEDAFAAAADPKRFPEQLQFVKPWRAKRILWNGWLPILEARKADLAKMTSIDVGEYNSLLGKSYTELAAESRSQHKSQGFGASGARGETLNYFDLIAGDSIKPANGKYDVFEGVDMTWNRVTGGARVAKLLEQAQREYNLEKPDAILPTLLKARAAMAEIADDYWVPQKRKELDEVIRSCAGMWIEALVIGANASADAAYSAVPGGTVKIAASLVNRSTTPLTLITLKSVQFPFTTATVLVSESDGKRRVQRRRPNACRHTRERASTDGHAQYCIQNRHGKL